MNKNCCTRVKRTVYRKTWERERRVEKLSSLLYWICDRRQADQGDWCGIQNVRTTTDRPWINPVGSSDVTKSYKLSFTNGSFAKMAADVFTLHEVTPSREKYGSAKLQFHTPSFSYSEHIENYRIPAILFNPPFVFCSVYENASWKKNFFKSLFIA